jgi:hypothetical protein
MADNHYIVPATAGWFVAIYVAAGKDYDEYLKLEPIIAWGSCQSQVITAFITKSCRSRSTAT